MIVNCQSKSLTPDYLKSSIDARYNSALMTVNGNRQVGLGIGIGPLKGPFSFSVKGIHKGWVSVKSKECNLNEVVSYVNSEEVIFTAKAEVARCLIAITVMPEFSSLESNSIEWRSLQGFLLLRRDESIQIYDTSQFSKRDSTGFKVPILEKGSRLVVKGCDINIDELSLTNEKFFIVKKPDSNPCLAQGFIKGKRENRTISFLVSSFDSDYLKLPKPSISFEGGGIFIQGSSSVSFISANNHFAFSDSMIVRANNFPISVVLYSAQGRASYCFIRGEGNFSCLD